MPRPESSKLVRMFDDWSGGIGHLYDSDDGNGLYFANGILGLRNELRPAPYATSVTLSESMIRRLAAQGDAAAMIAMAVAPIDGALTVTFDAGTSAETVAGTSVAVSHTIANQTNRMLFAFVCTEANEVPDSVTFGAAAMTLIQSIHAGAVATVHLYGLIAPAVSTANITVTLLNARDVAVYGASVYNAAQTLSVTNSTFSDTVLPGWSFGAYVAVSSTRDYILAASTVRYLGLSLQGRGEGESTIGSILSTTGSISSVGSRRAPLTQFHTQYYFEESTAAGNEYLYLLRGRRDFDDGLKLVKISLNNSDFGTYLGEHDLTEDSGNNDGQPGQPARYQGFWYLPCSNVDQSKLTVGDGNTYEDIAPAGNTGLTTNSDHLSNLGHQLAAHKAGSGTRILDVDGNPEVDAEWGEYFPTGEKNERATAVRTLDDLSFVLKKEGLYSFNEQGRAALVFDDFRIWRDSFSNISMVPWRKGFLIPHPSGLLYWTPGALPINVGFDFRIDGQALPPSGPTSINGGRYHGVVAVGDYVYAIYQPLVSGTTAYVLAGYSKSGNPTNLTWQILGSTTMADALHMLGIGISLLGSPVSASYATPSLWYGNGQNLNYIALDQRAGPFRTRVDTHRVVASGEAWLPEIILPEPIYLDEIVIFAQDMVAGDEWQVSVVVDGQADIRVSAPIISDGRTVLKVSRHDVYRMMLHISWSSSITTSRVPPSLKRIDLYGRFK